jgi:hypothetical protein
MTFRATVMYGQHFRQMAAPLGGRRCIEGQGRQRRGRLGSTVHRLSSSRRGPPAAGPNVIVVRHIDIKDHLLFDGVEL